MWCKLVLPNPNVTRYCPAYISQAAKADIVENDRSKLELQSDVRLLCNFLERAKGEKKKGDGIISSLKRSVRDANATIVEVSKSHPTVGGGICAAFQTKEPL